MTLAREFVTPEAIYDVCYNEGNANQIMSAGGDGSLKLWDML